MEQTAPSRRIPIYKNRFLWGWTTVDGADYTNLVQYLWRPLVGRYACRYDGAGKSVSMHRQLLGLVPGDGLEVDHINGDGLDNRRENLRACSRAENMQNVPSRKGSSRYRGVYLNRHGSWIAQAKVGQKHHYIGSFATEDEAGAAAAAFRAEHFTHAHSRGDVCVAD
jgi:hypothetical protein